MKSLSTKNSNSSKKILNTKNKSNKTKKDKTDKRDKLCVFDCCIPEVQLDCCSPQFLILDKLRQGWDDVAVSGGSNIPKELVVEYNGYNTINNSTSGISNTSTASVKFNNVFDRCGNNVLFPGNGTIVFNYNTYLNPPLLNSLDVAVTWNVSNQVYNNLLNLGQVNTNFELFGKYYAYFYYTTIGAGQTTWAKDCSGNTCSNLVNGITETLYQGWRGMTWSQFITNQIPYSSNSVNNNLTPNNGFANSSNGVYTPPNVVPTNATIYTQTPTGSYNVVLDNALWAYLFVNTNRYIGIEACGKLDQVIGWYINLQQNQLILLQNLPELGLTTLDNLEQLNNTDIDDLTPSDLKKFKELSRFYSISLKAIDLVKNDPKESGNIVMVEEKCSGRWLVAVNVANSTLPWTNNNNEYVVVVSKLC